MPPCEDEGTLKDGRRWYREPEGDCPDLYERRLRTAVSDPELQTIDFACQLLERCDDETRYRVLTYLVDRFGPAPVGAR